MGALGSNQLRDVQIEDLLGRAPSVWIWIGWSGISGRTVLITGGAGSIGSELARQVTAFGPGRLILVDQAESLLYFIHLEISRLHPQLDVVPVVADITDQARIEQIFAAHRPSTYSTLPHTSTSRSWRRIPWRRYGTTSSAP